jgi:multiple sugar transport system permease protein
VFPYVMLAPALLTVGGVIGVPLVRLVIQSTTDLKLTKAGSGGFVGFTNYLDAAQDGAFWMSIARALLYAIGVVLLSFGIGLLTANLLNRHFRVRALFRTLYMLPWALPLVAGVLTWGTMLNGSFGLVNRLLSLVTAHSVNIEWLLNEKTALPVLMVIDSWHQFPVAMVFILAGLQAVPTDLYEAARVDGANAFQEFFHITLPGLKSVSLVTLLMLTIWAFRRFDVNFLLTNGGPNDATDTLIIRTYRTAFQNYAMGEASALGVASILISLVFAVAYLWASRRQNDE